MMRHGCPVIWDGHAIKLGYYDDYPNTQQSELPAFPYFPMDVQSRKSPARIHHQSCKGYPCFYCYMFGVSLPTGLSILRL